MAKAINNNYQSVIQAPNRQLMVVLKSILIGMVSAVIVIFYRLLLTDAEQLRNQWLPFFRQTGWTVGILFLLLLIMAILTGWLLKKYPLIGGSGIPQVKGQIRGLIRVPWLSTLLAKFVGGLLTGLAGLSLGREGPSIQLGASAAHGLADRLAATRTERKILIASGAAAGLAAAFNAPLAGVIFVFEEIFRYISPLILLSSVSAAVVADYFSKLVFGFEPVFAFQTPLELPLSSYWLLLVLGLLTGLGGTLYNWAIMAVSRLYRQHLGGQPIIRMLIPFLLAGVLGLTFPIVLGGGHAVVEALTVDSPLLWLLLVLVAKFIFSAISFGSGAPGGIFFPLLILGALIGAAFASLGSVWLGLDPDLMGNFVILAMAGYFTAIVRAPITGVILLTEMTGSFSHMLALTIVSVTAYMTAERLHSEPIYDSLLHQLTSGRSVERPMHDQYRKITIEAIVHHGAALENKKISELNLPEGCLIIALRRHGLDITPRGNTEILAEDHLVVLTNLRDEATIREMIGQLTEHE